MILYNSLGQTKQEFIPHTAGKVNMYTCGPTVYHFAHIGNLRTYIMEDVLEKYLRFAGYDVKRVMNITDVGHLSSDADTGEDKMLKGAKREHKTVMEIAKFYTDAFFEDCKKLNIKRPDVVEPATNCIDEFIHMVSVLLEKGYAYIAGGNVYFDTSKLDNYYVFGNMNEDDLAVGVRDSVEEDNNKRNKADFVLWFTKSKFDSQELKWESPWGLSYPGWHIECSAMGQKYLGEVFDIHTGGIDLIPTHHENEIAQSKGACGKIPARFWIHGEYLLIDGGKMSKSLNNVYLVKDIEQRGYDPLVYRLFTYSSSYRNKINFTWDVMDANAKALEKLREGYQKHLQGKEDVEDEVVTNFEEEFHKAINDDLNMPLAMSVVWDVIKYPKKSIKLAELLKKFDGVMALSIDKEIKKKDYEIPEEIIKIAKEREKARKNKDWTKSDELRDLISKKGFLIKDLQNGYKIEKKD